jgi:hypothetical protein
LQDEYERRGSAKGDSGAALTATAATRSQKEKRGPKCFECGKYGHIRRNSTKKRSSRGSGRDSDSEDDAETKKLKKKCYSVKASDKKRSDRSARDRARACVFSGPGMWTSRRTRRSS